RALEALLPGGYSKLLTDYPERVPEFRHWQAYSPYDSIPSFVFEHVPKYFEYVGHLDDYIGEPLWTRIQMMRATSTYYAPVLYVGLEAGHPNAEYNTDLTKGRAYE